MGLKMNSKLTYPLLMASVMLGAAPLKAMEKENEDSKGLKAVSRKVDASRNVLLPDNQQEKSRPIGVSINPQEPFTLQNMAQRGIVMMIEKHAENWVEIAEQSLEHIRQFRGITDFGNFEQQIYEAVISHFVPIHGTSEHFRGEYFLPSQLTSRVDTLFAETKDEESQRSMERAIEKHINTHIYPWTNFKGFRDFWKDLSSFQGLGASVNFRDRFREALRKGEGFALNLSNKDLRDNSVFLNMFGSLDVRSLGCVDDEFLGEVAKYKSIKRLDIHYVAPESMDLLGKLSQVEELNLYTDNISDISSIAEMPNLHTLVLNDIANIHNHRVIDLNPLLDSPSLKNVTFWGNYDVSSLKGKFEVVKEKKSSVTLERKKSGVDNSQN